MVNFEKLTRSFMWEMAPLIYRTTFWTSRHPTSQQIILVKITPIFYGSTLSPGEDTVVTIATINFNKTEIIANWKIKPFVTFEKSCAFPYEDPTTSPEGIADYIIKTYKTYKKYKPVGDDRTYPYLLRKEDHA